MRISQMADANRWMTWLAKDGDIARYKPLLERETWYYADAEVCDDACRAARLADGPPILGQFDPPKPDGFVVCAKAPWPLIDKPVHRVMQRRGGPPGINAVWAYRWAAAHQLDGYLIQAICSASFHELALATAVGIESLPEYMHARAHAIMDDVHAHDVAACNRHAMKMPAVKPDSGLISKSWLSETETDVPYDENSWHRMPLYDENDGTVILATGVITMFWPCYRRMQPESEDNYPYPDSTGDPRNVASNWLLHNPEEEVVVTDDKLQMQLLGERVLGVDYAASKIFTALHVIWDHARQAEPIDRSSLPAKELGAFRRRHKKIRPDAEVKVCSLKPKEGRAASPYGRAWPQRHVVRGHWRRQWYASTHEHRPVWIKAHLRGGYPGGTAAKPGPRTAYRVTK